jgi:hypothetical protein
LLVAQVEPQLVAVASVAVVAVEQAVIAHLLEQVAVALLPSLL